MSDKKEKETKKNEQEEMEEIIAKEILPLEYFKDIKLKEEGAKQ